MVDVVAELLPRKPPETLYHYTTQAGLVGVVKKREIWATHTQYLNDRREYHHAIELVRTVITERVEASDGASVAALRELLAALNDDLAGINVCVCSFSEDGDSLSQWRAYCEPMAGFSLGFDSAFLASRGAKESFSLAPCLYELDEQRRFVGAFVDKVLAENLARKDPDEYFRPVGNFVAYLHRIAPVLKDRSFRSEKEWRLISMPRMSSGEHFDYRPGTSMLRPFFRLQLPDDPDTTPRAQRARRFRRVIVGPTPNPQQAMRAVGSLLASVDLMNSFTPGGPVAVEASAVPYRSW